MTIEFSLERRLNSSVLRVLTYSRSTGHKAVLKTSPNFSHDKSYKRIPQMTFLYSVLKTKSLV